MNTITIPSNIEDATSELTGIESLLTAKGWARCAIIASFVVLSDEGGDQTLDDSERMSPSEFAQLGIAGLKSHVTVRKYVRYWLTLTAGEYPEPGDEIDLPKLSFPPPFVLDPDTEPTEAAPRTPQTEESVVRGVWRRFQAELRAPDLTEWTTEHAGESLDSCVESARAIIESLEHFIHYAEVCDEVEDDF